MHKYSGMSLPLQDEKDWDAGVLNVYRERGIAVDKYMEEIRRCRKEKREQKKVIHTII